MKIKISDTSFIVPHEIAGLLITQQNNINEKISILKVGGKIAQNFPNLSIEFSELNDASFKKIINEEDISEVVRKNIISSGEDYCVYDVDSFKLKKSNNELTRDDDEKFYNIILQNITNVDFDELGNTRSIVCIPKLKYLAAINAIMRKTDGFISREDSSPLMLQPSTGMGALHVADKFYLNDFLLVCRQNNIDKDGNLDRYAKMIHKIELEKSDINLAIEAIAWFKQVNIVDNSEFEQDICDIISNSSIYLFKNEVSKVAYSLKYMMLKQEEYKHKEEQSKFGFEEAPCYVGDEKDRISSMDLKLVGGSVYGTMHNDTHAYYFETIDGRSVVWNASNAGGFDCLFNRYNDIKRAFSSARRSNIWINVKASVKERKLYRGKEQTVITRVKSTDEVIHTAPFDNGMIHFDEKYTLREFKVLEISESETKNSVKLTYQYKLEDENGMPTSLYVYKLIDGIEKDNYMQMPTQDNHGELVGVRFENIVKIDEFTVNFEPKLLTKLQASRHGIVKA
jgi:hypothetical protein